MDLRPKRIVRLSFARRQLRIRRYGISQALALPLCVATLTVARVEAGEAAAVPGDVETRTKNGVATARIRIAETMGSFDLVAQVVAKDPLR
jgi:hypothetical protein